MLMGYLKLSAYIRTIGASGAVAHLIRQVIMSSVEFSTFLAE